MAFHVMPDGSTSQFAIAQSSGSLRLDMAAAACVSHWRYKPQTVDGTPVEAPWKAAVIWKIPEPPPPPAVAPTAAKP